LDCSNTYSFLIIIENLNSIKKRFSFLNPSWAALKYFDEQQFLRIVQGQGTINSSQVLGRLPRRLNLPSDFSNDAQPPQLQHYRTTKSQSSTLLPSSSASARAASINRQPSFSSSSSSLRPRSSTQSQNQLYERSNSRLEKLRHNNSSHRSSTNSIMKNRSSSRQPLSISRSNSTTSTQATAQEKVPMKSLEGLLCEHFTYGGEDINLFANGNTASNPSPTSGEGPSNNKRESHLMSYDKDFQLSPPPPPKRRASLTTSFDALSFYNNTNKPQQGVKLTRSPSFSSIIQNL
jgi:hypothetical protein